MSSVYQEFYNLKENKDDNYNWFSVNSAMTVYGIKLKLIYLYKYFRIVFVLKLILLINNYILKIILKKKKLFFIFYFFFFYLINY